MSHLRRVRVLTSYTGLARFHAECADEPVGSILSRPEIPSPYAYSPTWTVWDWKGVPVVIVETKHKRYEVFRVESGIVPVQP